MEQLSPAMKQMYEKAHTVNLMLGEHVRPPYLSLGWEGESAGENYRAPRKDTLDALLKRGLLRVIRAGRGYIYYTANDKEASNGGE